MPTFCFASIDRVVPKEGFEPTHPCEYCALNAARLPFRHFGTNQSSAVASIFLQHQ